MATLGNAGRVGATILIAAVLFGAMWTFFTSGLLHHTYLISVLFDDASGISPEVPVQIAGVKIGVVEKVSLVGHKADLRLRIDEKYKIPVGSHFVITTPVLGTTGVVTIVPPDVPAGQTQPLIAAGATNLTGERASDLNASLAQAGALLEQVTQTAHHVNVLLSDPGLQHSLKQTVANVSAAAANANAASANGARLTKQLGAVLNEDNAQVQSLLRQDNAQVQSLLSQTQAGARVSMNNIAETTTQIKETTRANRTKINAIIADLQDTTAAVSGITGQANGLLREGGLTRNLSASVANLKTTSDHMTHIAESMDKVAGDPALQGDLKQTVRNLRDTTDQADYLLQRLNRLAGNKPRPAVVVGPGPAVVIPGGKSQAPPAAVPLQPRVDLLQDTRGSHFRTDLDAFVPLPSSPAAFGRVGVYGLGDESRLILQYGQALAPGLDGRYGLYASKLGVGADLGLGQRTDLSVDLYDPNRFHLDVRGHLSLGGGTGLLIGSEDITRRGGLVLGLELRR